MEQMKSPYAVSFESFCFQYATQCDQSAVGPVSWHVQQGAFCLLAGDTGSGKSTLLKQLKPELSPHGICQGTALVLGEDPRTWSTKTSARTVGYVAQNPDNQAVCSTVWHELAFGLENLGTPQDIMGRRVAEAAHFFGIEPWLDRQTDALSGGQKQILNLAGVMAMQPKILLLDEPTAQLDPVSEQSFLHALFRINRQLGVTVIVATHQPETMEDYATQVFRIVGDSTAQHRQEAVRKVADALRRISLKAADSSIQAVTMPGKILDGASKTSIISTLETGFGGMRKERARHNEKQDHHIEAHPVNRSEAIAIKDAYVSHPGCRESVLRSCDLKIAAGEFHALIGGNGCGKTTLLSAIAGILKPKRGRILNDLASSQALLPQNPKALFVADTVWEELTEWTDEESALRWLAASQLEGHKNHHPYDLSGGQQQLLALAKLLATAPALLLLDEPTKGLDAAAKMQAASLLLEAKAQGATILMASHDLPFVQALADRVSLMFDGGIACTQTPTEFFTGNLFYRPAEDAFAHLWSEAQQLAQIERPMTPSA